MSTARGFTDPVLPHDEAAALAARARQARGSILTMTSIARSGHPGGSFSSLEMLLVLYNCARLRPQEPAWPDRDRVVVSHGHVSPGVYAALADAGFFDVTQAEAHFRQAGSPFEGHVERSVPGVEWDTGNLGQGLSAGVGFAIAARLRGADWHTYVAMSDGEQNKGQVAEARRLVRAQGLTNITALVDLNRVQISGHTDEVMPVDVPALWHADGWEVVEVDGHDVVALYAALAAARHAGDRPVVVIAHTLIGKGVSFMEDDPQFHGRALDEDEYSRAMAELGAEPRVATATAERGRPVTISQTGGRDRLPMIRATGVPRTYEPGTSADCRSAWGHALIDMADLASEPIAVFDCDLAVSVKTDGFAAAHPEWFIECGVGEHNAAASSGACACTGLTTFLSDFGVFGVDEVYNQQRLNDINDAGLKVVVTHCGLDVGEDGKTHQCLDYIGALRDFFGWRCIVPADANQCDRAVRAAAGMTGNVLVAMGRSKLPVMVTEGGDPMFAGDYTFSYGRLDRVFDDEQTVLLVTGTPSGAALEAVRALRAEGRALSFAVAASPLHLSEEDAAWVASHRLAVTVEDHSVHSGLGATVALALSERGAGTRVVRHGVKRYSSSGSAADLYRLARLDAEGIEAVVREALG